jgi:predicted lipoprotein with Yx(FWY)xxD motif
MLTRIATVSIVLTLVVSGAALASTRDMGMGTMVYVHSSNLGKVLSSYSGRTLYLSPGDGYKVSNCTGPCAQTWLPITTVGKPRAGTGVKQGLLSTLTRPNGKKQVTYNGHPLYKYVGDTKAGTTTGEGVDGVWFVIKPNGNQAATRR